MKIKLEKEILDRMSKDPGNWVGPFYHNRRDPRLVVPKYNPNMGLTLNFASPYAWLTLAGIIAASIAYGFL
ncbi:DUF5808 domain-containing protein [Mangrovibacterium lignilyticum]|uniref:DUF5808 domain-containing protein n=1 Tax=Mangrovibacterium lignilyticum TaxID=2668052 RepID=UPI0013D62347|nr:DUF5808 domain-containing protein [Mangrovibacterium lignilyticum]